MISFLFFVKIAQNGELRSGDLFPHVFLFPERSEKPLVYRAAAAAPQYNKRMICAPAQAPGRPPGAPSIRGAWPGAGNCIIFALDISSEPVIK